MQTTSEKTDATESSESAIGLRRFISRKAAPGVAFQILLPGGIHVAGFGRASRAHGDRLPDLHRLPLALQDDWLPGAERRSRTDQLGGHLRRPDDLVGELLLRRVRQQRDRRGLALRPELSRPCR